MNAGRQDVTRDEILPDEALVQRVQKGDEAALGALFDRHADSLMRYALRWIPEGLSRKVSVSDLLQEARIVAFQRFSDFVAKGPRGSFRNWLLRILELKAREIARRYAGTAKRAAAREVTRGARADTAQFAARGPSPSEAAIGAETADLARRAMAALPEDYREVLRLVREEGLTLREAAARMGRSREAVKKLYGRALARLTEHFDGLRGGGDA